MNKRVARVLKGYSELNESEKGELVEYVNQFRTGTSRETRVLNEELGKSLGVTFGPAPNACPCCGR